MIKKYPTEFCLKYLVPHNIRRDNIKYTVQVLPQSNGYLNLNRREQVWYLLPNNNVGDYQTHFTQSEIDEMKDNPFFAAINWDNVKIEPVEDK